LIGRVIGRAGSVRVAFMFKLAPLLQNQVDTLDRCSAAKGFKVTIENVSRGGDLPSPLDRFVVNIPYGGADLKWAVIFNAADLTNPPDFVPFADDVDDKVPAGESPYGSYCELGAIGRGWNIDQADALYQAVVQIRMAFQKEQKQRVLRLPAQAVVFQYESFLQYLNGLECLVTPSTSGNISVRFTVPLLSIDDSEFEQQQIQEQEQQTEYSQLNFKLQKPPVMVAAANNESRERVLVTISYNIDYSNGQPAPRFNVTFPHAMTVSKQSFRQPQWNSTSDIVSYLPQLQRCWLSPWRDRWRFFHALSKRFDMLESDVVDCRRCMLLAKGGGVKKRGGQIILVVRFMLDVTFPASQRSIRIFYSRLPRMRASQPVESSTDVEIDQNRFRYSPRWHPERMADEFHKLISTVLTELVPKASTHTIGANSGSSVSGSNSNSSNGGSNGGSGGFGSVSSPIVGNRAVPSTVVTDVSIINPGTAVPGIIMGIPAAVPTAMAEAVPVPIAGVLASNPHGPQMSPS
jgi:hypothetical protein